MLARIMVSGVFMLAAMLVAACSGSNAPPPAQAPAAKAPPVDRTQATKGAEMYRQLLQSKSYELAAPIGQEIVAKYPDSSEAKEIQQTLADTVAKANAITARRRLERLWIYQSGKESGGQQNTASIYNSTPASERVRLVLRRHSAWGQSVYLFGSGKGFECESPCTVSVRFDEAAPVRMKAHIPETGEPAIFISDDRAFMAKMTKASKISIDAVPRGKSAETLVFEVAGYDADKFGPIPKK